MNEFLEKVYWGNTVQAYFIALIFLLITYPLVKIAKNIIIKKIKSKLQNGEHKTVLLLLNIIDNYIVPLTQWNISLVIVRQLRLSDKIDRTLAVASLIVTAFFVVRAINYLIKYFVNSKLSEDENGTNKVKQFNGVIKILTSIVWILGLLFVVQNTGHDVSTFVAGLGIGGIAIALAAQNILSDIFNYFVIFFDKPFEVGDYIAFDTFSGTITNIGIKTTRLKSINGEQLVISNSNLMGKVMSNYKRMETRRISFRLGVEYSTPTIQLERIPDILKNVIIPIKSVAFDRAHFCNFGDSSLDFEVVYIVQTSDYTNYMDAQQDILYAIYKAFEKENIGFAFPTQTLFVNNVN